VRVLIVEDAPQNLSELEREVLSRFPAGTIDLARSRDAALARLDRQSYDLVILDRRIPTADGVLDDDVAHGEAIFAAVREDHGCTPVVFWTAFPDEEFYATLLEGQEKHDYWGTGPQPSITVVSKSRFDLLVAKLEELRDSLTALDAVEIQQRPGVVLDFSTQERRLLRIATKRLTGTAIEVAEIRGGLSGTRVVRASVMQGARPLYRTVGKIGGIVSLRSELERSQKFLRLGPGAAPNIVCQQLAGAGDQGCLLYQLAAGHEQSLFEMLRQANGQQMANDVRALMRGWSEPAREYKGTIRDLRRQLTEDDVFARVRELMTDVDLEAFEAQQVTWHGSCCHGDLHGENILVNQDGRPMLIDAGEIDDLPAAVDPITLELSLAFHPAAARIGVNWPTIGAAARWGDLEAYVEDCTHKAFVRACREWAFDVARGNRAMYAVAYAYVLRQFKYEDTSKDLAKALIRSIMDAYSKT